jgi:hypothetical protein
MERKSKVLVYLPRRLYIQLHERMLTNHVSYLVSRLLEEFLQATDVRISWAEMSNKAEQREYLERKLREFLSRNRLSTELPKLSVQERPKQTELPSEPPRPPLQGKSPPTYMQEPSKEVYTVSKAKPIREEPPPPPKEDSDDDLDILKSLDNLW